MILLILLQSILTHLYGLPVQYDEVFLVHNIYDGILNLSRFGQLFVCNEFVSLNILILNDEILECTLGKSRQPAYTLQ